MSAGCRFMLLVIWTCSFLVRTEVRGDGPSQKHQPAPRATTPEKRDSSGDCLPLGAIARLGTVRLRSHGLIASIVFSPDGKSIAAVDMTGMNVGVWDTASGRTLNTFHGNKNRGEGGWPKVTFTADGRSVASVDVAGRVRRWDLATGKKRADLDDNLQSIAAAFSLDGKIVALAGKEEIRFVDVETGNLAQKIELQEKSSVHITFSPDGRYLAMGDGGSIRIWEAASGKERHHLQCEHISWPHDLCPFGFTPDGKILAGLRTEGPGLLSGESTVHLWKVSTGNVIRALKHPASIRSMAVCPKGKFIATVDDNQLTRLWDLASGKEVRRWKGEGPVVFSPDGKTLASGIRGYAIRLWDVVTGKETGPVQGPTSGVSALAFSPDGVILAWGSTGMVRLWDVAAGRDLPKVWKHDDFTLSLHFSGSGKILISTSNVDDEDTIRLWEAFAGKEMHRLHHDHDVVAAFFSADGRTLVSGCHDNQVRFWNVSTGKKTRELPGLPKELTEDPVAPVALSADGTTMAATAEGGTIRLWHALSGDVIGDLTIRDEKRVVAAAFSPDGKVLALGRHPMESEWEGTIELWEVATRREVGRLLGHWGAIESLAFSPDGRLLASGSADTTGLIWSLPTALQSAQATELDGKKLDELWNDLGNLKDAARAYRAAWTFILSPSLSVPFFKERLAPVVPFDAKRIRSWIGDLASDQFAVREKAMTELANLHELAEPALKMALTGEPSLDLRRRLELLLSRLEKPIPTATALRALRATAVLEQIATPASCALLERLALGTPEATLTKEAKASLDRLARRSATKPVNESTGKPSR